MSLSGGHCVPLANMLAAGRYVGESSLNERPILRFETRAEGGISSSGPAESLFVFDYVIDNPFIRSEHQYDGQVRPMSEASSRVVSQPGIQAASSASQT